MFSLISWNVRGLGSTSKHNQLRDLIYKHEAKFVFVCETKKSGLNSHFCSTLWNIQNLEFRAVDTDGMAGGLLTLWDGTFFRCTQYSKSKSWILVEGFFGNMDVKMCVCCVYGDSSLESRIDMWEQLKVLKQSFRSPWLVIGDLNETVEKEDRKSNRLCIRGAGALRSFMDLLQLREFPLTGRKFTWANKFSASKIDRAFGQPEWTVSFHALHLQSGPRGLSDHWPLILAEDKMDWGFKPFRFQDCWWQAPKFVETLQDFWKETEGECTRRFCLLKKLGLLRKKLAVWNKSSFVFPNRSFNGFQQSVSILTHLLGGWVQTHMGPTT
ncbi:hypothetical protein Tsubulata_038955 [Turnera subulata]|uniref:Endonuclease/exonuclease/phosphatase domain-containing protein n=1 Tax=Turnera subulata TaxID=218843 RepID=A0A9Q0FX58_9ROSI|nr:hypothetical protein Tsubulata_038955 [Turnera subulata]